MEGGENASSPRPSPPEAEREAGLRRSEKQFELLQRKKRPALRRRGPFARVLSDQGVEVR